MSNWKLLDELEYKAVWNFVYGTLLFRPYNEIEKLIILPVPHKRYSISGFYDSGFDEGIYDNLHDTTLNVFKQISPKEKMYALNWQHECYSFSPLLTFEKDEFDEWLISIFPNGDYLFFLTADFKNGVFADGIHLSISFFGDDIVNAFEKEKPEILMEKDKTKETV